MIQMFCCCFCVVCSQRKSWQTSSEESHIKRQKTGESSKTGQRVLDRTCRVTARWRAIVRGKHGWREWPRAAQMTLAVAKIDTFVVVLWLVLCSPPRPLMRLIWEHVSSSGNWPEKGGSLGRTEPKDKYPTHNRPWKRRSWGPRFARGWGAPCEYSAPYLQIYLYVRLTYNVYLIVNSYLVSW